MNIAELTVYAVELPLRRRVAHASASRDASSNLLVRCLLGDGTEGWGEGVPRPYVTGETIEGAFAQLEQTRLAEQLSSKHHNWQELAETLQRLTLAPMRDDPRQCYGNALRCAVELSILDAYGQLFGDPLSELATQLNLAQKVRTNHTHVRYSSAITAEGPYHERWSALKMRCYGFRQVKVKVGVRGDDDARRLRCIRRWIGSRVDLRVDANEAWSPSEVRRRVEELLPASISCVEQPVPHAEVNCLAELRKQVPVPVMLDESLTSMADAEQAIRSGTCDLFNIRLSKCGGYLSSLRLAARAHEAGLGYQLGCHPGESGILSAAGRHFAASVKAIRYLEGSYDRHLLKQLLTNEDITFGYGGWAPALTKPGLGVTINPAALARASFREQTFAIGSS